MIVNILFKMLCNSKRNLNSIRCKLTYISFFILRKQLVDSIGKQPSISLGILTDALNELRVLLSHIVQFHIDRHLLPVCQCHLQAQTTSHYTRHLITHCCLKTQC